MENAALSFSTHSLSLFPPSLTPLPLQIHIKYHEFNIMGQVGDLWCMHALKLLLLARHMCNFSSLSFFYHKKKIFYKTLENFLFYLFSRNLKKVKRMFSSPWTSSPRTQEKKHESTFAWIWMSWGRKRDFCVALAKKRNILMRFLLNIQTRNGHWYIYHLYRHSHIFSGGERDDI